MMCECFLSWLDIELFKPGIAYDYHGPWDTNVTDQAPVTNPHTSLLDMHASALLYIRAGIDLSKGKKQSGPYSLPYP
jgi:hypothetical protein